MSRLSQHQQKQNFKKSIFLLILTGIILYFLAVVGFPLLANSAAFINRISNKDIDSTATTEDEDFIGSLHIDSVPIATNSAEIYISGNVSGYEQLEFYINNEKVEEASAKNTFNEKIGSLKNGENIIIVKALTKDKKHERLSEEIIVNYKQKPLELEIETPKPNDTVHDEEIQVIGTTNPGATISVNNSPVVVNFEGKFSTFIKLKEGENEIQIKATDRAGNTKEEKIKVIYQRD